MEENLKQILLKDLCARLPYGVKLKYVEDLVIKKVSHTITLNNVYLEHIINGDADIKPYLRPMSSMTEEEKKFYKKYFNWYEQSLEDMVELIDWFDAHHFDFRNIIERGLAIDCTNLNIY